jgi:thiol-disulfide isomerase/thioredoxin
MNHNILICLIALFGLACNSGKGPDSRKYVGLWKLELSLEKQKKTIPFFLEIVEQNGQLQAAIWNGDEKLEQNTVEFIQDSLIIGSAYFNSRLVLRFEEHKVYGYWVDFSRGDYKIKLTGKYNLTQRFRFKGQLENQLDGKWQTVFSPGTDDRYSAIGLFSTDSNSMKATFITETGDYRFLEGGFSTGALKLSTFDGSHAFLFEADLDADTLRGWFYSGKHWKEPFIAWKNASADLISPYELTALVDKSKPIDFAFKDVNGDLVSLRDSQFGSKPVLLQIMGSWCPNCMDEAVFLTSQEAFLKSQGVEVIAISFERLDYLESVEPIKKLQKRIGISYPILYGGTANKKEATKAIPWLKEIKSYPTLIYVLPNRIVLKIHTGFYGPGTGLYYEKQSQEMLDDIKQLSKLSKTTL